MDFERPVAENTGSDSWSEKEIDRLLRMRYEKDMSKTEIADEMEGRSVASVENKLRKVKKARGTYNHQHANDKYQKNTEWVQKANEELDGLDRVFDGYAGTGKATNFYFPYASEIQCCEIKEDRFQSLVDKFRNKNDSEFIEEDDQSVALEVQGRKMKFYQEDVNRVLHRKYGQKADMYDFIDLDPCGSPFTSVPQAIRLIEDGYLAVTYGDLSLRRWGRHNPLMKAYRMPESDSMKEALEYMIGWTMFEGIRQNKAKEARKLEVEEVETFEGYNKGTIRVLYRVTTPGTLNDIMEFLSDQLVGFEDENNPLAAKYEIEEVE